jgi:hypothetical protein
MVHVVMAAGSGKRPTRPPTYHFERLLEKACPNHTYPVKHKLRDCGMMKNFMVSESLTQSMELDEFPNEDNTMPFPGENVVITIYHGRPLPGMRHMSNPSPGAPTHYGWGHGDAWM